MLFITPRGSYQEFTLRLDLGFRLSQALSSSIFSHFVLVNN